MPRSFRGYTILRPLGMGGMASIYLGVQENLQRQVAIKLLDKRLALNDDFVRRFEREARAASELSHRNIITIHEFGNEEDDYYIVMEFVDGTDLREVLAEVPVFPPEVALVILEEIATGLAAAHEKDIVHRDIKPANVLVSRNGDVKVTDFGLARDFGLDTSRLFDSLTVEGTVLGTPSYMSPEQASSLPVDDRTDMFSLGVLAWEMFTGVKPFTGASYSEVRDAILQGDPPKLDIERPLAVPQIADMLRRMLRKEPGNRPSMRQLLHHVESCMEALDPSGTLLRYRRRFLEKFAADPVAFAQKLERNAVRTSLDRGIYAKALGLERLDQALEHLEFVQKHDPENPRAKEALKDIRSLANGARGGADAQSQATEVTPADERSSAESGVIQKKRKRGAGALAAAALSLGALVAAAMAVELGWIPGVGEQGLAGELTRLGLGSLAQLLEPADSPGTAPAPSGLLAPPDSAPALSGPPAPPDSALASSGPPAPPESAPETVTSDTPPKWTPGRLTLVPDPELVERSAPVAVVQKVEPPPTPAPKRTPKAEPKPPPKQTPKAEPERTPKAEQRAATTPEKTKTVEPLPPPEPKEGWMVVRTRPEGNFFLNGALISASAESVLVKVPAREPVSLEVRHPELWGSKTWTRRVAGGDTLDLGTYEVATGTVRVTTRPHAPIGVLIDGRATRKETPLALTVASRQQLVSMQPPGWLVEKVVVTDRTAGSPPREIVPEDPSDFPGVLVEVPEGHDLKVVFHLARAK